MFNNAGEKIEKVAKFNFWFFAVATIVALFLVLKAYGMMLRYIQPAVIIIALIGVAVLIVAEYIICLCLAGFGQLINNTAKAITVPSQSTNSIKIPTAKPNDRIVDNAFISEDLPDL